MKILGGIIVAFGVLDLVGSFIGLDVWSDWIRVELPGPLWTFSAYIEIAIGALIYRFGSRSVEVPTDE